VKVTAEWQCTRCGSTNRKLVDGGTRETIDQCVSCHQKHVVTPGTRPVRWMARAA
jgi:hypothetical protein